MPSANLGNVGPQQGKAVSFDWKWTYSAPGCIIWMLLILAIVLPKANHNPRILLIFVPLAIVNLFWLALKKITGMPSSAESQYDTVFYSMAVGLTVLWLVMHYFNRFGGYFRFLLSLVTLITVAGFGALTYSTVFSKEMFLFLAFFAFLTITILCAAAAAGKLCNWKYRPRYFVLWLAVWTLLISLFTTFGFFVVGTAIMSSGPGPDILMAILMLSLAGLIIGLCLYMLNLPFMILGFANSFFRERFCACLFPSSISPTIAKHDIDPSNEQNTSSQKSC